MTTVVNLCISCPRITEVPEAPSRGVPQCKRCHDEERRKRVPAKVKRTFHELRAKLTNLTSEQGRTLALLLPFCSSPRPPHRKKIPDGLAYLLEVLDDETSYQIFNSYPAEWKRDRDLPEPREWRG